MTPPLIDQLKELAPRLNRDLNAIIEGKTVQWKDDKFGWRDIGFPANWNCSDLLAFLNKKETRIKPEPREWYEVRGGTLNLSFDTEEEAKSYVSEKLKSHPLWSIVHVKEVLI